MQTLVVGGGLGSGSGDRIGSGSGGFGGGDGSGSDGGFGFSNNSNNSGNDATDSYYRTMIEANPGNALLLGNYAKFLKEVNAKSSIALEILYLMFWIY